MRFLHTSDWHLGRALHGESLLDAQGRFVDFLVDTVQARAIDVVLVAGDLYDRAIPAVDAIDLFDHALSQLAALGVPVILIGGNHDSPARLNFGSRLMDAAGVHLRTDIATVGSPVVLTDDHGPVAIYPIPYLEPQLTWQQLGAEGPSHAAVLQAAGDRVRAHARDHGFDRTVVVAHAFVKGRFFPARSDSERDISVGGTEMAPVTVFDDIGYVALGHLHGFQEPVPGRIAYSGTPLAYSFSEVGQTKSVSLVDLDAAGVVSLEQIPCPVPRLLAVIRGELEALLNDPEWARYEDAWLSVTLTDEIVPTEPMASLRRRFPGVLKLELLGRRSRTAEGSYGERLAGLDDLDLAAQFVRDMRGRDPLDGELDLLRAAFEDQRIVEVNR
jgi:DNA repair protein SbcD/Mre11